MKCPKCGTPMKIELELIGGCHGHFGEDDRCYCDSPDARAMYVCQKTAEFTRRGRALCRQGDVPIHKLSDQYAIARWLTEHYKETHDAPRSRRVI